ncbi:hypothetical protein [Pseudodesulfovibrio sp.]|uniref:hypothetical protein n=1 Tax=unclassified Pseudodesulfovibrio TaxID=2661612 RepID=UPI003AFF9B25
MTTLGIAQVGLTTVAILAILFWQSSIVDNVLASYFDMQSRHEMELGITMPEICWHPNTPHW